MNWKIVECNLILIIGIIVLACLDCNDNMHTMRIIVIALLALMFLAMPWINSQYLCSLEKMKQLKKDNEALKEKLYNLENDYEYASNAIRAKEKQLENLEDEIKNSQNDLQLFYNSMLILWAKKHEAPLDDFEAIKKEYSKLSKLKQTI